MALSFSEEIAGVRKNCVLCELGFVLCHSSPICGLSGNTELYGCLSVTGHSASGWCGIGSCCYPCDPGAWPGLPRAPGNWPFCKLEGRRHLADLEGHRQPGWVEK